MKSKVIVKYDDIYDANIMNKLNELNQLYLTETYNGNKVAYYYEDINSGDIFTFNAGTCFYAASTIKILVCLMLFEEASKKNMNLSQKILIKMEDIKQGTGILKNQKKDTEYTILELIKYAIIESDNTAYLKLMEFVGKNNVAKYGRKMGANYTLVGKETDSFGIINCYDMIVYWKKIKQFIDNNLEYGNLFKEFLLNTSTQLINEIDYQFVRKYGSFDLAYHEAGYIECDNPYYLIVLTQLNKKEYKEQFINDTATKIKELHKLKYK